MADNELAIVYKAQGDYPKAISTLERGLKFEPSNVKLLNELAIVYKAQGDYPKAISTLERAIELGNLPSYNELAIVYKELGNYKEARALIDKGLSQQPNNQFLKSTRAAIDRAEAKEAANQFKSTMENLKQMIATGQLAQAIEQLLTLLKEREDLKPFEQECLHLSSRYNQLEKNTRLGILSNSEETRTRNQLVDSFLNLLEQIENNP